MIRERDNIPAIFNPIPKRVRAPSVVITGDSPNGFTPFTMRNQDSISSSQQDPNEVITINADMQDSTTAVVACTRLGYGSSDISNMGSGIISQQFHNNDFNIDSDDINNAAVTTTTTHTTSFHKLRAIRDSCCSKFAKKMYFGICVTILVTASWVGATHCIKFMYLNRSTYATIASAQDLDFSETSQSFELEMATNINNKNIHDNDNNDDDNGDDISKILAISDTSLSTMDVEDATETFILNKPTIQTTVFSAPFFAAWFFTNFSFLYFPIYILGRVSLSTCDKPGEIFGDVMRGFRDRGFTIGRFFNHCLSFCILWLVSTYLYTLSLRILYATDALALFATNVACVYLLSWVILHEQFVGVRIVAVILCDTGIALLAYMDGITESPTLSGVVLATLAAAGYAVFRVMFRKVMGDPPVGQIAFTFTVLGFLNAILIWPVCLALYLTGIENLPSNHLQWIILLIASILLLVFHLLTQFSAAVTYNMFVTLGLITAVPVSGALDVILYGTTFAGMKLAGVILISIGFFLVMFPENWPDYITRLLRSIVLLGHNARWGRGSRHRSGRAGHNPSMIDYRTGYIKSHLRSPSGRVR